jgi:nitrite reductase/ring-hydroxylating ferredoxin subunit
VSDGQPESAIRDGVAVCLVRVGSRTHVFADRCPHRGHPISEGAVVDGVLRCALHGWEFDVESGRAVSPRAPFALERIDG